MCSGRPGALSNAMPMLFLGLWSVFFCLSGDGCSLLGLSLVVVRFGTGVFQRVSRDMYVHKPPPKIFSLNAGAKW